MDSQNTPQKLSFKKEYIAPPPWATESEQTEFKSRGEVAWHLPAESSHARLLHRVWDADQMLSCLLKMGGICYMNDVRL